MLLLQFVDQLDISLLGVLGLDSLVGNLLPGTTLCFLLKYEVSMEDPQASCVELVSTSLLEHTFSSNMPGALDCSIGGSWVPCLNRP